MLTSKNNDSSGLSINEYPSNLREYKARAKTITLQFLKDQMLMYKILNQNVELITQTSL